LLSIDVGPGKTGIAENNLQSKDKCPSFCLSDFLSRPVLRFSLQGHVIEGGLRRLFSKMGSPQKALTAPGERGVLFSMEPH
jgi:hypothetical protein